MFSSRLSQFLAAPRNRWRLGGALLLVIALAVIGVFAGWFGRSPLHRSNSLLESPALALETLQAKPLFFNGPAQPWLAARRPDLLPPDAAGDAAVARAFAQAVLEPKLFRQLDRRFRFEALLFIGDPTQSRPLLEHLAETKDWSLSYVDHLSMVFRRGSAHAWKMEDLAPVRARFAGTPAWVRATMLAQTAVKLVAARNLEAAKQLLDEARGLDARVPEVWSGLASYHMQRGEYADAFAEADRALKLDPDHLPALSTKTQLLYATKQFSAAYDLSQRLLARVPDDPNLLFYHAKIAHEAHAYKAEIEVLKKIIAQAQAADRPVSGYQMYLGQAYTTIGDAPRAIDAFMNALNDPDLPQDQRDFARESIARIKKKTGL